MKARLKKKFIKRSICPNCRRVLLRREFMWDKGSECYYCRYDLTPF